MSEQLLSANEARVLGSLLEKSITTPENYPLSLNALVNACNQKSSREPVMSLDEGQVREALHALESRGFVHHVQDARVGKWEHSTGSKWNLRRDESALLTVLMLRGPQTPGELRTRAERLYEFTELEGVTSALERLAAKQPPMAQVLPRQPGAREARWRELVSDAPAPSAESYAREPASAGSSNDEIAALRAEMAELRTRIEALEAAVPSALEVRSSSS